MTLFVHVGLWSHYSRSVLNVSFISGKTWRVYIKRVHLLPSQRFLGDPFEKGLIRIKIVVAVLNNAVPVFRFPPGGVCSSAGERFSEICRKILGNISRSSAEPPLQICRYDPVYLLPQTPHIIFSKTGAAGLRKFRLHSLFYRCRISSTFSESVSRCRFILFFCLAYFSQIYSSSEKSYITQ